MPPADDNTPDFDSMTPEELMAWMETLAERQGATEGFTTEERVDIEELDPETARETGPGYIPYGMTAEEWEVKRKQEEEDIKQRVAARKAQQSGTPPAPTTPPAAETPPTPEPAAPAASAAAAPASGGEPDFDSMTPEELMAWMETLAERQGATEGFTTEERVDIEELDPETARETGPGYIPYGMTAEEWEVKRKQEEEDIKQRVAARKAQQSGTPPPPTTPPAAEPSATPEPELEPAQMSFDLPPVDTDMATDFETTEMAPSAGDDGLAWLESLAADQGEGDFPEMDLGGLGDDIVAPLDLDALETPAASGGGDDPMAWLESLSQGDSQENALASIDDLIAGDESEAVDQTAIHEQIADLETDEDSDDSDIVAGWMVPDEADDVGDADDDGSEMAWLESLARSQGADPEEFGTDASVDVNDEEAFVAEPDDAPGYEAYAYEDDDMGVPVTDIDALDSVPDDPDDPVAWLDSLAASSGEEGDFDFEAMADADEVDGVSEEVADDADELAVLAALNNADDVSPEAVKSWMDNLLEQGATRTDAPPDYVETDDDTTDEEAMEANIPDWLTEQVGPPPDLDAPPETTSQPALLEDIVEPDDVEIPDWLQEDSAEVEGLELGDIFTDAGEEVLPASSQDTRLSTSELSEIDAGDSWVEAFEMERKQGAIDVSDVPDWYRERLEQIGGPAASAGVELAVADLEPETTLPHGELQAVPDWAASALAAVSPITEIQEVSYASLEDGDETAVADDAVAEAELPDWLRETVEQGEDESGMPDWLKDAGIESADDVPDWLRDTVDEDEEQPETVTVDEAAEPEEVAEDTEAQPVAATTLPAASLPRPEQTFAPMSAKVSPAPVEAVPAAHVAASLEEAREQVQAGDVDAALLKYEAVVRSNTQLEAVQNDLNALMKDDEHKKNAAVLRVLGDTLMRRGDLQAALDTYRKALNLL